ncbi:hypothetical protein HEAR0466 [Herminiimonas arsenicoxydans]|uniref:Lipoprotein n=1 Tax=Herminiimonas arsenicoxydans TaxID=204773 RepID=A4G2E4_HERAR|nr:hypothetical protein HEAR0466 [Herminiimonas arsenicoxydans]
MNRRKIPLIGLIILMAACTSKPFQPAPPMFKMFEKNNLQSEEIKKEMIACGFPNVITGRNPNDSLGDTAKREHCMFKRNFRYIDGYMGICSTQAARKIKECISDTRIIQ